LPEVVLVVFEEPTLLVPPSLTAPVDSPLFVVLASGAVLLPGVVVVVWANAADDAARPNKNTLVANKRDISSPKTVRRQYVAAASPSRQRCGLYEAVAVKLWYGG
jgi:hypothetical protein